MLTELTVRPVLYVEDDENDVFLLQYGFRKAQVSQPLKVVADGREAVDYLSGAGCYVQRDQHPLPCLLLLDLNLPLLSGMEVLQWVRGQEVFRDLPVVVLTSSAHPRDQERARELGAAEYLLKPADPQQFVELAEALKQRWLCVHANAGGT